MSKDAWFREYERLLNETEERMGRDLDDDEIENVSKAAREAVIERRYEAADMERKRRREEP